jgi:hypothetical protein
MGLNISVMVRNPSEGFNIRYFWKIFLIKSSRRIYFQGLTLRQAVWLNFSRVEKFVKRGFLAP